MLSIVSTPIGNLGDITLRAIQTLKECDAVICEDTRVTGNLLKQLEIPKKELISFHSYSDDKQLNQILERLNKGKHLALVSDAGTPCISDPGFKIVSNIRSSDKCHPEPFDNIHLCHTERSRSATQSERTQDKLRRRTKIAVEVIPGPSAFLAALSISGLPINQFVYLGFLPLKKGRKTLLESFKNESRTIVFYESVHRIEKTLCELADVLKEEPDRPVVVCRELTKMYEEVMRTTVRELPEVAKKITRKGEFVVVIGCPS